MIPSEDTALLERAQQGDVAAFEGLVARHRSRVYGLALRMLNSPEDAAEVLQESFLSAYRNLPNFRGDAQFGSWVYRIAANHALMRLRHRRVVNQVESSIETPQFNDRGSLVEEVSDFRDAEGEAMDKELRGAIEQAAARLGDEYREVFVLKDLEGMSYEEIAELTHSTVPAVKSRLHRARLSLRAAIDHFYQEQS
ncbi:MAG TPA: sigma-70 family RNA polymerase sigma factor [Archangium sp.]